MITRSGFTRSITGGHQRTPHKGMAGLAAMGRHGDTELAHVTPEEKALLKARGGAGTRNPMTGMPEFYHSDNGLSGGSGSNDLGGGVGAGSNDSLGGGGVGGGQEADIYGEQQAFNNALNAYRDSGSVYTGPAPGLGATVDQRRLEQSQPGWQEKAEAFALGTAMPFGVDARAVKDYMAGKPRIDVTWSPLQAMANMGPLGPLGDIAAPSWGEMAVGSFYPGEGEHAPHAGRGGESGGVDPNVQAQLDALLASVLREPQPDDTRAIAPANPAAAQTYTPFTGNPSTYGQPGGESGHAFFRAS